MEVEVEVECCECGDPVDEDAAVCYYCGEAMCQKCEREDPADPHNKVYCLSCFISQGVEDL